ncbi:MAG: hypothetical protein FK734_01705 [Asgard group archaeon]|nr:hypothetical protein [Asgard group archaeon]
MTLQSNFKKLKQNKRAQIFLVCTVIMTIYMLSFVNIVYELNVQQYNKTIETDEFEAAFDNLRTETNDFIISMMANFSQPTTIITSNIIAGQILQNWLDFAQQQIVSKGYVAVLEIDDIIPTTLPVELLNQNGRIAFTGTIDVYMECNYMTIDTQFNYEIEYLVSYTNTATEAIIDVYYNSLVGSSYIGYAIVTVNAASTTSYYNGSYIYPAPLVGGDTIQCTTPEQILITYVV